VRSVLALPLRLLAHACGQEAPGWPRGQQPPRPTRCRRARAPPRQPPHTTAQRVRQAGCCWTLPLTIRVPPAEHVVHVAAAAKPAASAAAKAAAAEPAAACAETPEQLQARQGPTGTVGQAKRARRLPLVQRPRKAHRIGDPASASAASSHSQGLQAAPAAPRLVPGALDLRSGLV
jgi:hypothetical protein